MKNQLISNLGNTISKKLGKTSLKNAPDILPIGGAIRMAAIDVVESLCLSKIEKEKENDQNEESINQ